MRASLQERLERQIRNEEALKKNHWLEFVHVIKLGAMLYSNAGREVDTERIKECELILKEKAGFFSNFRGILEFVVQIKMALSDDPAAYLDGVISVYQRLKAGRILPGELLAMAATTIYDNCPPDQLDEVVEKTREAYAKVNEQHPILTGESDMALVALMVMAGKDPEQATAQAEELFGALKEHFPVRQYRAQTVAMVLALSEKPAAQKVNDFLALYEACKEAHHAAYREKEMAIYAAYADLDYDLAELVAEIGEADDWLKKHKGYKLFGVGISMRRMMAAALVLEDRQKESPVAISGASSAVVQAVVEEIVMIIIMIIVTSAISSAARSSSH